MRVLIELDDPMPMTIEPILIYAKLLNLEIKDYDAQQIAHVIDHLAGALEFGEFYFGDERDAPLKEVTQLLNKLASRLEHGEEVAA